MNFDCFNPVVLSNKLYQYFDAPLLFILIVIPLVYQIEIEIEIDIDIMKFLVINRMKEVRLDH